ncbi:MAG: DUF3795 domain-containing protein [Desulfobacterota bacterium]|nr:DUF3795 domain-containing protein [Thermodesulfobacteriota bacterium]
MEKMIACCGLECTACPAYIATKQDNDMLRKETAALWGRQLGVEVDPESISCDGCLNSGRHLDYCAICRIRPCCREKNLQNRTQCAHSMCDILKSGLVFLSEVLEMGHLEELEAKKILIS